MKAPLVSVVIPTWNRASLVAEAVRSVLDQTVADLEAIVVDDGSTDDTAQTVASLDDPRVRYISKEHSGIAATRNRGIAESRGRYLAFLDSDDLWVPEKLEKQIPLFIGSTGFVYARYRSVRDGAVLRSKPVGGPSGRIFHRLLQRIFVQMSTAVVTREAAEAVGPLDEKLRYSDEYEWFLRLSEGFDCAFVDEDLVIYRIHDSNESRNREVRISENLEVYRRILARGPEGSRTRTIASRRVADYAAQLGDLRRDAGDLEGARTAYVEGLTARPWSLSLRLKLRRT